MIKKILRKNKITSFYLESYFISKNFLKKKGWYKSRFNNLPVDADGNAIPWYTYSSLFFLEPRLKSDFSVFEYGSGQSTIWYSQRVEKVVSLDHDLEFYEFLKPRLSNLDNVELLYEALENDKYSDKILNYVNEFDIIVVDGRERVKCTKNIIKSLKENGVVVFDNSDRIQYQAAYDFLLAEGFNRIDFCGMGPMDHSEWLTSIFYKRNNNCLEI